MFMVHGTFALHSERSAKLVRPVVEVDIIPAQEHQHCPDGPVVVCLLVFMVFQKFYKLFGFEKHFCVFRGKIFLHTAVVRLFPEPDPGGNRKAELFSLRSLFRKSALRSLSEGIFCILLHRFSQKKF